MIQALKKKAGGDVSVRMTPYMKHVPLESEEKEQLITEVEGASERMMNHLLFGLRAKLPDKTFRDVLDAMEELLSKE